MQARNLNKAGLLGLLPRVLAVRLSVLIGLIMGAVLVAGSMVSASQQSVVVSSDGSSSEQSYPIEGNAIGRPDAPVQIIVYSDPQCSHCLDLHDGAEAEIIRQYVQAGKARMEMRLIAVLGPESEQAVYAANCAAEQNRFWEYRDALLARYRQLGRTAYSPQELKALADKVGLNSQAWSSCVSEGKGKAKAASDRHAATSHGVKSVPTVFINGRVVNGAYPFDHFRVIIEEELAK